MGVGIMQIDLLPTQLHRRRRIFSALRAWSFYTVLGVSAFAITYVVERGRLQSVSEAVDQRELQFQPIVRKQAEIKEILSQLAALRSREAIAYALEDRHPALTLVATVSDATVKTEGKLNIDTLMFDRSAEERRVVTMNGQVVDHLGMAEFLSSLRASKLFRSVDPKWIKAKENGEWTVQEFEVECLF